MISNKTIPKPAPKTKLHQTFIDRLELLKSPVEGLEKLIQDKTSDNPFIEVHSNFKKIKGHWGELNEIEICVYEEDLYEKLISQITPELFPSEKSKNIAIHIIENIDIDTGFLELPICNLAKELGVKIDEYERVRKRFYRLEPCGIGALNSQECLMFQLYAKDKSEIDEETYELCKQIIYNLEKHIIFKNHKFYQRAIKIIKSFNKIPTLSYAPRSPVVIPDILIFKNDREDSSEEQFTIEFNNDFYPKITIKKPEEKKITNKKLKEFIKDEIKRAESKKEALQEALRMRGVTLYKVASIILELQKDFFEGNGSIKAMKIKDIAKDLGYNESTISRAIADKYLLCDAGLFPLRKFFSEAIDENTSASEIKDYLCDLVKHEDKEKPLSDEKILHIVEEKFKIKIVRRTITKYRKQLDIASSGERKRLYKLSIL